jgi:septum formation protein
MQKIILASASPARLALLRRAGLNPEVVVSGVDESTISADTTAELTGLLARAKARTVAAGLDDALVIGCDSVLDFEGRALGKPESAEVAAEWWRARRGRAGILHTGHCLINTATGQEVVAVAGTTVRFGSPTEEDIAAYLGTGEPLQVAGAFTIDGMGAWFVDGIDGDAGNVIGLSLPVLRRLFTAVGVRVTGLWARPAAVREPGGGESSGW